MRIGTLASAVLAATVLSLICVRLGPSSASAHDAHPGLNFWIAVDGVQNCNTKTGNGTCNLAPGSVFVIDVYLDPLPNDILNYAGFDIELQYSGVTGRQDASTAAWPNCGFPLRFYRSSAVLLGCTIGVPPAGPSTYTGLIGTNSFACSQTGSISMVPGPNHTDLVEDAGKIHTEDTHTTETLTINCVQGGVTPIPSTPHPGRGATSAPPGTPLPSAEQAKATATAKAQATGAAKKTPTTGGGGGGGGGLGGGVIAIIVVAAVAVAGGAGFFGWRYIQSRRGAGPAP